jgi:three-Cys-motif partner protein
MAAATKTLWPLDPHTRGKHLVLQSYLNAWLPIMGTWNGRILFIDGFAGPGEYEGGELGSPLIALTSFKNHIAQSTIKAEVVFHFIEQDPARAGHLTSLIAAQTGLPPKCKVNVVNAAFDATLTSVLDAIEEQQQHLAPAFVMIDPFGVSDTPMEVVRRILKNPKCEVYVSFMYEFINRFKTTAEFPKHLDGLFGTDRWRDGVDIKEEHARKDFFFGLYKAQLRSAGAKHVVHFELYEGQRLVYAIFFGTQHLLGTDRMKQAIWKVAPFGDFAFHGTHSSQLTLGIAAPDFEPLKSRLIQEFKGKGWIGIEEIEEFVGSDQTDYYVAQLRKGALVALESAGKIEIKEGTRKRKSSYPPGTELRFL